MTTTLPPTSPMAPMAPAAPPRRKLGARISGGHLLMIVSGIAAFILIFAVFNRGSSTVRVAVATAPIPADTQVKTSMVKAVALPADSPLLETLVRYDTIGEETRYATAGIDAGVPIAAAQLSSARGEGDAPTRLMTIKVDRAYVGSGRVAKGDRIDIITVANEGTACRVVAGLRVVTVESSSGGALGGGSGEAALTVAIEQAGDDLRLATTTGKKIQVVQATGVQTVGDTTCVGDLTAQKPGR